MTDKPYIPAVIREIENRLSEGITAGEAARFCHVSPMQLHRDFYNATGYSIKAYIRMRRLSRALALLKATGLPPAEIAYDCGYGSQPLLCRDVKKATGLTPLQYRHGAAYFCFPSALNERPFPVTVSSETFPPVRRFYFYHAERNGLEEQAVRALYAAMPGYAGRLFGRDGMRRGGLFCYEIGVEEAAWEPGLLPYGFRGALETTPAVTRLCARITTGPSPQAVTAAWNYLYGGWLSTGMFEQDGAFFEEYAVKNSRIRRLILCLPVRKRPGAHRVTVGFYPGALFLAGRAEGPDAEERAAQSVMYYVRDVFPAFIREAACFYVQKEPGACVCGLQPVPADYRPDAVVPLPDGLLWLAVPAGDYAVWENENVGDGIIFERQLTAWAVENGLTADGSAFTLYEQPSPAGAVTAKTYLRLHGKNSVNNG